MSLTLQKHDLYTAFKYWESVTGTWLLSPGAPGYTPWIRASTGHLCIDVGDSVSAIKHMDVKSLVRDSSSWSTSIGYSDISLEQTLISNLPLDGIHVILASRARARYDRTEVTFRAGRIVLGAIWPASDVRRVLDDASRTILGIPQLAKPADIVSNPWWNWQDGFRTPCDARDVMSNGWTRVSSALISLPTCASHTI